MNKKILLSTTLLFLLLGITQFSGNFKSSELQISEIPTDFVFDGCSMFPDGDYKDCCTQHDISYFFWGSWNWRLQADNELFSCIQEKPYWYHQALAPAMWAGVRIGGAPIWPTSFRWGFWRDRY